jgi:hypothetical protein
VSDFFDLVLARSPKAAEHLHGLTTEELTELRRAVVSALDLLIGERNRRTHHPVPLFHEGES